MSGAPHHKSPDGIMRKCKNPSNCQFGTSVDEHLNLSPKEAEKMNEEIVEEQMSDEGVDVVQSQRAERHAGGEPRAAEISTYDISDELGAAEERAEKVVDDMVPDEDETVKRGYARYLAYDADMDDTENVAREFYLDTEDADIDDADDDARRKNLKFVVDSGIQGAAENRYLDDKQKFGERVDSLTRHDDFDFNGITIREDTSGVLREPDLSAAEFSVADHKNNMLLERESEGAYSRRNVSMFLAEHNGEYYKNTTKVRSLREDGLLSTPAMIPDYVFDNENTEDTLRSTNATLSNTLPETSGQHYEDISGDEFQRIRAQEARDNKTADALEAKIRENPDNDKREAWETGSQVLRSPVLRSDVARLEGTQEKVWDEHRADYMDATVYTAHDADDQVLYREHDRAGNTGSAAASWHTWMANTAPKALDRAKNMPGGLDVNAIRAMAEEETRD